MSGLETAFYIIGIVFMGLSLILLFALVTAVFVIRAKVNKIHKIIDEKINQLTSVVERSGQVAAVVLDTGKKLLHKR